MRFARALLASFGAGTCLVLAGTLAMATLSTVVAFSGLPGLGAGGADTTPPAILAAAVSGAGTADVVPDPVALATPTVSSRPAATGAQGAPVPRVATAGAQAVAPIATAAAPQTGLSATTPTSPASTVSGAGAASLPPFRASPGAKAPADPAVTAPVTGPVRDVGTAVGGIVAGLGDDLAETVQPLAPPVATIVGETTKVAGETVVAATDVVATMVEGFNRGR